MRTRPPIPRRVVALAAAGLTATGGGVAFAAGEFEPNDTASAAKAIEPGKAYTATLERLGDDDYYAFKVPAGIRSAALGLINTTDPYYDPSLDPGVQLRLQNSGGNTVSGSTVDTTAGGQGSRTVAVTAGDTYRVLVRHVKHVSGSTTTTGDGYQFGVALSTAAAPGGSGGVAGTATPANLGLPSSSSCLRRKRVRFKVRRPSSGVRLRRATIFVNGKRVKRLGPSRVKRRVTVRLRGDRKRYRVRVVARGVNGKRYVSRKTYRACKR